MEAAPIIVRTPNGTFRAGLKELTEIIPRALEHGGEKCAVSKFKSRYPAAKGDARLRSLIGSL